MRKIFQRIVPGLVLVLVLLGAVIATDVVQESTKAKNQTVTAQATKQIGNSGTLSPEEQQLNKETQETQTMKKAEGPGGALSAGETVKMAKTESVSSFDKSVDKGGALSPEEQLSIEKPVQEYDAVSKNTVLKGGQLPEDEIVHFKKTNGQTGIEKEYVFKKSVEGMKSGALSPEEIQQFKKAIVVQTDGQVKVSDNKLYLGNAEIKVMPDTASEKAIEVLKTNKIVIALKDTGKPVYTISGKKKGKLFAFWETDVQVATDVDAQTGTISAVKKPWWAFLVAE